jgi:novel protein kinase C epsilon type
MVFFNGSMKIKICEAADLKATDFATRHSRQISVLDPYISIDVDDIHVARTTSKQKSNRPTWNEEFRTEVHNGQNVGFTVFHDAAIPPDIFIANCTVAFEDLATSPCLDIWVTIINIFVGEFGFEYTK